MLKILILSFLIVLNTQQTNAQNCYQTKEGNVCDICAELRYGNLGFCKICGVAIEDCAQSLCPQSCINFGGVWNNTWKTVDGCGYCFPASVVTCGCIMYGRDTQQKIRKK